MRLSQPHEWNCSSGITPRYARRAIDTAFAERSGAGDGAKARYPQSADSIGNEFARQPALKHAKERGVFSRRHGISC